VCLKQVPDDSGAVPLGADGAGSKRRLPGRSRRLTGTPSKRPSPARTSRGIRDRPARRDRIGRLRCSRKGWRSAPMPPFTCGTSRSARSMPSPGHGSWRGNPRRALALRCDPDRPARARRGRGQVPGLLAEMLAIPQVTAAVKVEATAEGLRVERDVEGAGRYGDGAARAALGTQGAQRAATTQPQGGPGGQEEARAAPGRGGGRAVGRGAGPAPADRGQEASLLRRAVRMLDGAPDAQVRELLRSLRKDGVLP